MASGAFQDAETGGRRVRETRDAILNPVRSLYRRARKSPPETRSEGRKERAPAVTTQPRSAMRSRG